MKSQAAASNFKLATSHVPRTFSGFADYLRETRRRVKTIRAHAAKLPQEREPLPDILDFFRSLTDGCPDYADSTPSQPPQQLSYDGFGNIP
jgi:hypothetical protein